MKKILAIVLIVVSLACLTIFFSSCGTAPVEEEKNEQIYAVYTAYVEHVQAQGETPLSYDDWLLSVKGEKGEKGDDGETPTIEISKDGYWVINGDKTEYKAVGEKGDDGDTPTIEISKDGYWVINGSKTNHKATGEDGKTPTIEISKDGYWEINGNETEYKAVGEKGDAGETPYIGENGNWWIGAKDTGVFATYNYEEREITSGLIFTPMTVKGKTGLMLTDIDTNLWEEQNPGRNILNIPDYVGATPVIGIEAKLFENNDYIEKVSLSKNTIYLGQRVFYGCDNLKEIDFNESQLEEISEYAFYDTSLKEIELPTTCKKLGSYCFYNNLLQKINYENVTSFGEYCLRGYYGKPIYLTKDVEYVGEQVFAGNYVYIEHETVPTTWAKNIAGTSELSGHVTVNCLINDEYIYSKGNNQVTIYSYVGNAKRIKVPSKIDGLTVTKIGYGFNSITTFGANVIEENLNISYVSPQFLKEIVGLEEIIIPNTVKAIDYGTFQNIFTMVYIPKSVENMWAGVGMFDSDEDAATCYLMFESDNYPTLKYKWVENSSSYADAKAVYEDCEIRTALGANLQNILYDAESKSYYVLDSLGCSLMAYMDYTTSEIHIASKINGKSVHTIKTGAVSGLYGARSVIIDDGIAKIQRNAFVHLNDIKRIYIPSSVTIINGSGFANVCKNFYTSHLIKPDEWDTEWAGSSTSSAKINFNVKQEELPIISDDGLYAYRTLSDNTIELVKYLGSATSTYRVPRVVDGKVVSKICSKCYNITVSSTIYIYVPKTVVEIEANAFYCSYNYYYTTYMYFETDSRLSGYDTAYTNVSTSYLREYWSKQLDY